MLRFIDLCAGVSGLGRVAFVGTRACKKERGAFAPTDSAGVGIISAAPSAHKKQPPLPKAA